MHQRPCNRHIHYKWSAATSSKNEDESQIKIHCVIIWSVNCHKGQGNQMERTQKIPGLSDNAWHISYNNNVYGSDLKTVQGCRVKRSCHTIGFAGWRFCGSPFVRENVQQRCQSIHANVWSLLLFVFGCHGRFSTKMIAGIAPLSKMVKLEWKTLLRTHQRSNLINAADQRSSRHFTTFCYYYY